MNSADVFRKIRIEVLLDLAGEHKLLLNLLLLDELAVEPGVLKRQTDVHRHVTKEVDIIFVEVGFAV